MRSPSSSRTIIVRSARRSRSPSIEEQDLSVIEVVTDGTAAVETAVREHPDVMLVDLQMPGVDGIEATRRIHEGNQGTAVIVLSGQDDDVSLARAIQAGARGFLPKSEAVLDLADAIRRAARGEPLHTSAEVEESLRKLRRRRAVDGNLAQRIERLTPRELQILQLMADGRLPREDLRRARDEPAHARTHTQNVLTKLGVHSKLDAIVAAIRYGKVHTNEVAAGGRPRRGSRRTDPA